MTLTLFHRKIVENQIILHRHLPQRTSIIDQNLKKNSDQAQKILLS
jgi:hypothetical protein